MEVVRFDVRAIRMALLEELTEEEITDSERKELLELQTFIAKYFDKYSARPKRKVAA